MPSYDIVIVGAGSAGCVLAARLSERPGRSVLLLEAGPDYPDPALLPADVADGWKVAESHDWGYTSEPDSLGRTIALLRGRLIGGCSSLNATLAPRGFPADYDAWAKLGNPGWSFEEVLPFFCKAETDLDYGNEPWHGAAGPLPIRRYKPDEWNALTVALLDAASAGGHPIVEDHNRPGAVGAGPAPVNALDGRRMSSALAYLNPARERRNLTVQADAPVDRVQLEAGRAVAVRLAGVDEVVEAGTVVLAAGAYGSPAILLRSGIGPAADLRNLGVECRVALAGVGRNLSDHPIASIDLPLTVLARNEPRYQTLLSWRSEWAGPGSGCDMQIFATGPHGEVDDAGVAALVFGVEKPQSRGDVRLRSADPSDPPRIRLRHLEAAADLDRMLEGLAVARRLAEMPALAKLRAGEELSATRGIPTVDRATLGAALRGSVGTCHHPTGTCAMGPSDEEGAVVDATGKVHGVDALVVADASVMPEIPGANTNLPTIMVAERIAALIA